MIEYLGSDINGFELNKILRKPIVVPETKSVQELLADFQTSEVHMAGVIDEYGGTAGLVTIEDVLEEIVGEARKTHEILDGLLSHRIGNVYPGEDIVLVAVWSTHRKDAFAACREIMEALKSKAPFWKKETLVEGDRWVENNTPGV